MPTKAFFLMRLNDHIQYLKKIEATLAEEENFKGTNHYDCKLGEWLYGEGADEVASLGSHKAQEIFDSLFEPHERFHSISKHALEKKQLGDKIGIQMAMTEMYRLSHIITQKLLELDTLT
jgi:hypothetical protein